MDDEPRPDAGRTAGLFDARILIVDEDPGAIQDLGRVLAGYGQLRFATRADEALRIARDWRPELILLDLGMRGGAGPPLFATLQADPALSALPVILITGAAEPLVEASVFEAGAADFVCKPVAGPALRARVAVHLRFRRLARAQRAEPSQDGLTGLADRWLFDGRLAAEWARALRGGRALSLLIAAVDHFGAYNEVRGSAAGEAGLRRIAGLLQGLAQRPGDLAARHGADEFALLLPDTDAAGAAALGERLLGALRRLDLAHPASPVARQLTLSIGVATLSVRAAGRTAPRLHAEDLREAACAARDAARGAGRDRTAVVALQRPRGAAAAWRAASVAGEDAA